MTLARQDMEAPVALLEDIRETFSRCPAWQREVGGSIALARDRIIPGGLSEHEQMPIPSMVLQISSFAHSFSDADAMRSIGDVSAEVSAGIYLPAAEPIQPPGDIARNAYIDVWQRMHSIIREYRETIASEIDAPLKDRVHRAQLVGIAWTVTPRRPTVGEYADDPVAVLAYSTYWESSVTISVRGIGPGCAFAREGLTP